MDVKNINNTNFKAVNVQEAAGFVFSRLNKPKRYAQFIEFSHLQKNKPYDIILSTQKDGRLSIVAKDRNGATKLSDEESKISNFFNFNPIRFMKKFVKKVEKINN